MKVQVSLSVDSEVKAVGDSIEKLCNDIKAKKSVGEDVADLTSSLLPAIGDISKLPDDLKASADNRKYLAMALEGAVEVFLMPAAAPAPAAA